MKCFGRIHILAVVLGFTIQASLAQEVRFKRIKRQFPFIIGDETTEVVSRTHTPGRLVTTPSLVSSTASSKAQTSTLSSPLSSPPLSTSAAPSTHTPISTATTTSSSSGVTPTSTSTGSSSASSSPSWQIIGIAVICITVIGVTILAIAFYDQWSRFLKDVMCGKKQQEMGTEEFLPEEKNESWARQFTQSRFSNIRYPAQILSPPMAAQPLTRQMSRPVRPTLLQRFSGHGRPFQQLAPADDPYDGICVSSPASLHPRVDVGQVYPASPPGANVTGLGIGR